MTITKFISFQTTGVEVSVKSVNIPETSDSVVSFFFIYKFFNALCYAIILTCVIWSI